MGHHRHRPTGERPIDHLVNRHAPRAAEQQACCDRHQGDLELVPALGDIEAVPVMDVRDRDRLLTSTASAAGRVRTPTFPSRLFKRADPYSSTRSRTEFPGMHCGHDSCS